jgi:hypothetical protein
LRGFSLVIASHFSRVIAGPFSRVIASEAWQSQGKSKLKMQNDRAKIESNQQSALS